VAVRLTLDEEVVLLKRLASEAKLGVLEIGVYLGGTTAELASAMKSGVPLFGIDPIKHDQAGVVGSEEEIRARMVSYGFFTFFKTQSHQAAAGWTAPLDLIFVDGDHSYEAAKQDFEDWWPLLSDGGHMAFHDAAGSENVNFVGAPGVMRFTDELIAGGYNMVERVATVRVFKK
jgi:predicted O-methyltransferase YrrM